MNQTAKGIASSYDALINLLESIARFLSRLAIYNQIPHTTALDEMIVKIMMEFLSTLALATKAVERGRSGPSALVHVVL